MAGTFDNDLYIMSPCFCSEFAQHIEFEELRTVVGIVYRARTHTVTQRNRYVILF